MLPKKYLTSLILLCIGVLIIILHFPRDGCKNAYVEAFKYVFLYTPLIITFFVLTGISIYKLAYHQEKNYWLPVKTVVFLIVAYFLSSFIQNIFESRIILQASNLLSETQSNRPEFILRSNNKFELHIQYIEASCVWSGKYQLHEDTLMLHLNKIKEIEDYLSPVYLIDFNNKLVSPISETSTEDSTKYWSIISYNANEFDF